MKASFVRRCGPGLLAYMAAGMLACCPACPAQTPPTSQGMESMATGTRVVAPLSDSLTVTLNGRSFELSPAELSAMPQTSVTVRNAHTNTDEQYTGVAMADLFGHLGLPQNHGPQQAQLLRSFVRAQGTDNYFVLFSAVEVDRELHKGNVLVALRKNGQPLQRDGQFQLVSTEDNLPMRSVRNLTSLTFSTVN